MTNEGPTSRRRFFPGLPCLIVFLFLLSVSGFAVQVSAQEGEPLPESSEASAPPEDAPVEETGVNKIQPLPPLAPSLLPPIADRDTFLTSEARFHGGDLEGAQDGFESFLKTHPNDPRVPQAILYLATLDYEKKSYVSALRLLDFLILNHSGSAAGRSGRSLMGKCFYELGRLEKAEETFTQVLRNNPDGKLRWEALAYLGKISAGRAQAMPGMEKLLEIYNESADETVKSEAASQISKIVDHRLDKAQLIDVSRKYLKEFPGDLALIRLMELYRNERDAGSYQIVLEDFISRFPAHPKVKHLREVDRKLKSDPRRVIRLGAVLPLSGERALVGQKVLQGIQLAFNQLSLVDEERLELVVRDSGLERDVRDVIRDLAEDPNVVGLIGPILSDEVRQSAEVLEEYQLAAFTPTASSPGLADLSPNIFRNALTREIQANFLAQYAVNDLELYRFVILYPQEIYGEQLRDIFSDQVRALGGTIVESVPYDRNQSDFKEQILKIGGMPDDKLKKVILRHLKNGTRPQPLDDKGTYSRPVVEGGVFDDEEVEGLKVSMELNYDAIFIPGFYDKVGLIAPQLVFYNIENVRLLGTSGWNSPELVTHARNYLRSALFVDGFFSNSRLPQVQRFRDDFIATFGEDPPALSAQAYDTTRIMIQLIRDNAQNRLDILKRLPKVKDFPGVAGKTTILPSGEAEKQLARLRIKGHRIVEEE